MCINLNLYVDLSQIDHTSTTGLTQRGSDGGYKDDIDNTKRTIDYYNRKLNKYAFGSSIKRFDSKQDLKNVYNIEPGPGSYLHDQDVTKERGLYNDSTMSSRNYNTTSVESYSYEGDQSTLLHQSKSPGFGSKDERFKTDFSSIEAQNKPGPGSYELKMREKLKGGLINPKPTVALNFNENNPLNYVRPITVNLYFKQDNPGVGKYDSGGTFGKISQNI